LPNKYAKKEAPSLPMGLLFQQQKQKKEVAIGQALAPCICRLLCGHVACLSRTLYGDFIIADFFAVQDQKRTNTKGGQRQQRVIKWIY